jgi:kinesin family protein 5
LEGFNGTIFAYGQTSSGKTHTMQGVLGNPEREGIIPRMIRHVFNYMLNSSPDIEYTVKVSMIEIYMEKIKDLIDMDRYNLNVREDKAKGIYIEGLSEHYVASDDEVLELMEIGSENRSTAATNMNEHSSRSHSIFIMTIHQNNIKEFSAKTGKLYLVDLAGSEKISKTGATGLTLEEAKTINKSLTTLGMVINSLTDGKSTHIPYRESKLTRVLQESLGGNAKTCLIITCSPSIYNDAETLSTLRFGVRAKNIKNKPKINKEVTVAELKIEIEKLDNTVAKLQKRVKQLENYIRKNGLPVPHEDNNLITEDIEEDQYIQGDITKSFIEDNNKSFIEDNNKSFIDDNNKSFIEDAIKSFIEPDSPKFKSDEEDGRQKTNNNIVIGEKRTSANHFNEVEFVETYERYEFKKKTLKNKEDLLAIESKNQKFSISDKNLNSSEKKVRFVSLMGNNEERNINKFQEVEDEDLEKLRKQIQFIQQDTEELKKDEIGTTKYNNYIESLKKHFEEREKELLQQINNLKTEIDTKNNDMLDTSIRNTIYEKETNDIKYTPATVDAISSFFTRLDEIVQNDQISQLVQEYRNRIQVDKQETPYDDMLESEKKIHENEKRVILKALDDKSERLNQFEMENKHLLTKIKSLESKFTTDDKNYVKKIINLEKNLEQLNSMLQNSLTQKSLVNIEIQVMFDYF